MRKTDEKYALVLSKNNAGGVRVLAPKIRERGLLPLLISNQVNDLNVSLAEDHFLVSWDDQPKDVANAVLRWSVEKRYTVGGVVTLLDPLFGHCRELSRVLTGIETLSQRVNLSDKAAVRRTLHEIGMSEIYQSEGSIEEISSRAESFDYPLVVKPSLDTGGSLCVFKCSSAADLRYALGQTFKTLGDAAILVERFFEGTEYSIDCIADESCVVPIFIAEKTGDSSPYMHDSSILISTRIQTRIPVREASYPS